MFLSFIRNNPKFIASVHSNKLINLDRLLIHLEICCKIKKINNCLTGLLNKKKRKKNEKEKENHVSHLHYEAFLISKEYSYSENESVSVNSYVNFLF